MKKLALTLVALFLLSTAAFATDVVLELDDNMTVTGTDLENNQYEITVTQDGAERSMILDDVCNLAAIEIDDGYRTDLLRFFRSVPMSSQDAVYSPDFVDGTSQLVGQLDLETMTVMAEPIYYMDFAGTHIDFDYAVASVDTTKVGVYRGQEWAIDGKFGVLDRNFQVVVPFAYDKIDLVYSFSSMGSVVQLTKGEKSDLLNLENGKSLENITPYYSNIRTYDRFIMEIDGKICLLNGDLDIIAQGYSSLVELDYGKWLAFDQDTPVAVLDNNGAPIQFNWNSTGTYSDWATPYIQTAVEDKLINTVEKPFWTSDFALYQEELTRMGFCELVFQILQARELYGDTEIEFPFTDVSTGFSGPVQACYRLGIVNGKSATEFDPNASITRQEAAAMLFRLCNVLELDTTAKMPETHFADLNQADEYAKESILAMSALTTPAGEAIMGGTAEATFDPQGTYTLEQALTTLVRLLDVTP